MRARTLRPPASRLPSAPENWRSAVTVLLATSGLVLFTLLSGCCCAPPPSLPSDDCGVVPNATCSATPPFYCDRGALVPNPVACGCPAGQVASEEECVPAPPCPDGTRSGVCSDNQPLYCVAGTLASRASDCGCPGGFSPTPDDACQNDTAGKAVLLEQLIHIQINRQRALANLTPLAWNEQLAAVARDHSADMAQRGYFEHVNPDGEEPSDRFARHNYSCAVPLAPNRVLTAGENIYSTWLFDAPADRNKPGVRPEFRSIETLANATVAGWMTSPDHRDNLLTPEWQTEAIGVHIAPDHEVRITQNFC